MFARVGRGDQMLAPILDPAQRPIELHRQRRDRQFLRIEIVLRPEPAAHVRGDHPQLAFGDSQTFRQDGPDDMGKLRRAVDHQFVEAPVIMCKNAAAFHRYAGMSSHPQALANLDIGACAHLVEIAGRDARFDVDVVGPAVVNARRVRLQRDVDVPYRRQFLEIDDAGLRNVLGFRARRRDADRQQVAHNTGLVGGERRLVRRFGSLWRAATRQRPGYPVSTNFRYSRLDSFTVSLQSYIVYDHADTGCVNRVFGYWRLRWGMAGPKKDRGETPISAAVVRFA